MSDVNGTQDATTYSTYGKAVQILNSVTYPFKNKCLFKQNIHSTKSVLSSIKYQYTGINHVVNTVQ